MFVKQEYKYSCGVAVIATWLKRTHQDIQDTYFPKRNFNDSTGVMVEEIINILGQNDIRAFYNDMWIIREPGILFVPSLNVEGSGHYIWYGGPGILFDPNIAGAKKYRSMEGIIPFGHIVDLDSKVTKEHIISRAGKMMALYE